MMLSNKKILVFVEAMYEDLELWYPKIRLIEEGAQVIVAGPEKKTYEGKHGYPCPADATINEIEARDFHALVIPGGFAPDKLRRYPRVLEIVRQFHEAKKPIAFICHAGWVPISAKILRGRRVTGVAAIKDDLENAGAGYVDQPVVVDGHLITSRKVADLPDFCREIIRALE
jgi:protease I